MKKKIEKKSVLDNSELIKMADAAEMLWVVLANVSQGDWTKQNKEWQEAAGIWRDNYFEALRETGLTPPRQEKIK